MESINVEVINKLEQMAVDAYEKFETHEINGSTYVNKELHKVKPERCGITDLRSLKALVDFTETTVETNGTQFVLPLLVKASYNRLCLVSSLDENMDRNEIASITPIIPDIKFDRWMSMEEFIIQLQTCFVDTENKQALIKLVSKMTDSTQVQRTDDGIGQNITISKGTGLKESITINPIVRLKAYRTYQEVSQVETMYLIRVKEGGELKIIEADGGAWKLEAQKRISDYLHDQLASSIENGSVIIIG